MKKVFVDTNVILDFLLKREAFFEDARMIMAMGYNKKCCLFMSSLSFSNIAYIARKKFDGDSLYACFSEIRELLDVSPVSKDEVDSAINLRVKDFEDAMQYYSAKSIGADCIITRNVKDFNFSDIEVLTPHDFLLKNIIKIKNQFFQSNKKKGIHSP